MESKRSPMWSFLLYLAVFICIVVPVGLVLILVYEQELSSMFQEEKQEKKRASSEKKIEEPISEPVKQELANTPPVAKIVYKVNPKKFLEYEFHAKQCSDKEDSIDTLKVRWDFEGDGVWDTDYTTEKEISHTYSDYDSHTVIVEVCDSKNAKSCDKVTFQNFVPAIKRAKHKKVKADSCADCHNEYSSDKPCEYAQINENCMDCHQMEK